MDNCKFVYNKDKGYIKLKSTKNQEICKREVSILEEGNIGGFLPLNIKNHFSVFELKYKIRGQSLNFFLRDIAITKRLFILLINSITKSMKYAQRIHFSLDKIVWQINYVMIIPDSLDINFVYIPLQPCNTYGTLKNFLFDLLNSITFDVSENLDFVSAFIEMLDTNNSINVLVLEEYLNVFDDKKSALIKNTPYIICPTCNTKVNTTENFCPACGRKMKISNVSVPHKKSISESEAKLSYNLEDSGVVSMFQNSSSKGAYPILKGQNSSVLISSNPFKIGKNNDSNDFCINNPGVSRKHAEIYCIDGKYYLVDLNSTNGTFVSGKRINPGDRVHICDGNSICFANSEFLFFENERK